MKFLIKMVTVLGLGTVLLGIVSAAPESRQVATYTATPIKHLVIIFDENVSFDHYFGT